MKKTVYFDLETGGLVPGRYPIIQFAAIAVDEDFKEIEELEIKIIFNVSDCDPKSLEVNSFDQETWDKEAVPAMAAMRKISSFLKRHSTVELISKKGNPYKVALMAGHNAATFDGPFLQNWYKNSNEFLPGYFRVLCTLQCALWIFYNDPDMPKDMKLGTLCKHFGIDLPGEEAHDALADVRANVLLAKTMIERTK